MSKGVEDGVVKIVHRTQTATASCHHCAWTCTMTGVRVIELGDAVREQLVEHVLSEHPDVGRAPS